MPMAYPMPQAPSFEQVQKYMEAQRAQADAVLKQMEAQRQAQQQASQAQAAQTAPAAAPAQAAAPAAAPATTEQPAAAK